MPRRREFCRTLGRFWEPRQRGNKLLGIYFGKIHSKIKTVPRKKVVVPELEPEVNRPMPSSRWFIVAVAVLVVVGLLYLNKGLVVAGMVGNRPVWRWDFEKRLVASAGTQTFDQIVNEQILENDAAAKNITVSQKEVDDKIAAIEKSLAGRITLTDALAQQNMTMADLRQSVQVQILADKVSTTLPVTDQEINDYIAKNKDTMTATEEGKLRAEAKTALSQQKFQDFFANLKKSTKVSKFI